MKGRGYLVYAVFVVAACAAVAVVLTQRRTAQQAEDAAKHPAQVLEEIRGGDA